MTAEEIIAALEMEEIPEGGMVAENYKAPLFTQTPRGERRLASTAYYLLREGEASCFHRLKSDELWMYHSGASFTLYRINDGVLTSAVLGPDVTREERPQLLLQAGTIFGAVANGAWGLCGCIVSPGFEDPDIELIGPEGLTGIKGDQEILARLAFRG